MQDLAIAEIDTPAVLIDEAIVDRNIEKAQAMFNALDVGLRPHVKTHKIPRLAHKQLAAGAVGIACQKVSEAEIFADAGCDDILICFNILGQNKLARLRALAQRINLTVVADNAVVVQALSDRFASAPARLNVLVECDTGHHRCGIATVDQALTLAKQIAQAEGLKFAGLMTYPAPDSESNVQAFMHEAQRRCLQEIGSCNTISSGGTPSMANAGKASIVTEYRPGTYIYNDRSLLQRGACGVQDCALSVLSRIVSRPDDSRAIIDAGSKALTSDLLGLQGYGFIADYPDAQIYALSEEHGHVDFSKCPTKPAIGDLVRIIPNHACPVSNLFDQVHFVANGRLSHIQAVTARGCVH